MRRDLTSVLKESLWVAERGTTEAGGGCCARPGEEGGGLDQACCRKDGQPCLDSGYTSKIDALVGRGL